MKIRMLGAWVTEHLNLSFIIILFIWISFFPAPIQQRYYLYTYIFLGAMFLITFIQKQISLFKPGDFPLWLFLIMVGLNVLFAQKKDIALKTYLDLAIPLFTIYYIVPRGFSSGGKFNLLAKTICLSSIIVSLVAVLESLYAYNPIYEYVIENPYYYRDSLFASLRPTSTQFHSVVLGSYLLGCLPFNFTLFKQNKPYLRLLGSFGIVLNIAVIILVFSRGVLLGLIAAITFYLFMQKKFRSIVIFFIIVVLFVLLCSHLPYPFDKFGKDQMIMKNRGVFSDYRFTRGVMVWRIMKEHPLVGLGFQHFRIRFYEYAPSHDEVLYEFMIPDNMYLTFLAETGIMGTLGFFILIFSLLKKALFHLKEIEDGDRRQRLLMPMVAWIGLLVNMAAYELFYWPNTYILFCLLCALVKEMQENRA